MKIKRVLFFLLMLLVSATTIYSQIKIKEKVEINSKSVSLAKVPDLSQFIRNYTPCGPYIENDDPDHYWQVVWAGYWGPIDPGQQLFYSQESDDRFDLLPGNGNYDIQIIEGAEFCSIQENIEYEPYMYRWEDISDVSLTGITVSELTGDGDFMEFDCVPRYGDQKYRIVYNYLDQQEALVTYSIRSADHNKTKYYHT